MLVATEVFDEAALAALIGSANVLGSTLKAGLFTNNFTPTKKTLLTDLTEPTYTGYARQAVVLGAPFRDPNNGIAAIAGGLTWQMSNSTTPTIVYGIFYVNNVGPSLAGCELFPNPIPLNDAIDAFTTVLEYIESNANQGFSTVLQ